LTNNLDKLNRFYARNREEWHKWLEENHEISPGIWLIYYKKNSDKPKVEYEDAVEEALSFGWIDSKANTLDEEKYMQVFTPRKAGSIWSKSNKERVQKLIQQGRMHPAGIKKVEAAKKEGTWNFLDDIEELKIPEDLKLELLKNSKANENFNGYPDSVKKQVLYWIAMAKREETRKRRINKVIDSALKNEKPF
jgi:uncharacterized protein YdeI (YjbR/CyaY-like superfamily)